MQTISKLLAIGSILAFGLSACNSSSVPTPAGSECPSAYNPLPVAVMPGQKAVQMDPKENQSSPADSQMPPGRYTYTLADIIFSQNIKVVPSPAQIHYHDDAAAGVSVKQSMVCGLNLKPGMNIPDQTMTAATDIVVCPDFSQVVRTRDFHFGVKNSTIYLNSPTTPDAKNLCLTSSVGIYPKGTVGPFLLKDYSPLYEFRSESDLPDNSASYVTAVRMIFTPFTAAETANGELPLECKNKCFPRAAAGNTNARGH